MRDEGVLIFWVMHYNVSLLCWLIWATAGCAEESYFKIRASAAEPGIPAYAAEGCARVLALLDEPRLPAMAKTPGNTVYRFMICAAFGDCYCVRIQKEGKTFRLWSKHIGLGRVIQRERKELLLSEADSEAIQVLLARLNFFTMLSEERPILTDSECWLLEGVQDGRYNVVQQSSVDYLTEQRHLVAFYKLCKCLIEKGGLKEIPKNSGCDVFRQ